MEKSRFLRPEAQRQCPKPAVPLHTPTLAQCHPHHCPPPYGMIWTRNSTGLPAKHPSPHPTCQFISDLSKNSSRGLEKGPHMNQARACSSVSLLSEFTAAHTPSAPGSLTGLPHTKQLPSHLSSSYGFSFCPCFIYSRAQQAMLLNWTCVYKSWRACL